MAREMPVRPVMAATTTMAGTATQTGLAQAQPQDVAWQQSDGAWEEVVGILSLAACAPSVSKVCASAW